ncbi:MAG: hypothetical protein RMM17_11300 [Acidobacteriota bacterium]|nr:hypothetical protein [Blastocatellia bacterium]MDW8413257.1 hypothetical protein [Acidobacteriota bacterium]
MMKFKRNCDGCNATFFTADRKSCYCPKCRRRAYNKSIGLPTKPQITCFPRALQVARVASRSHRPAKATEVTPELRQKILAAYERYKGSDKRMRVLHALISQEVWAKPCVIVKVLKDERYCQFQEEHKQRIIDLYLDMMNAGVRPAEGRRRHIAQWLGLPRRKVNAVIHEWLQKTLSGLTREQLFEIEKACWHFATCGRYRFTELVKRVATEVKFASAEQVLCWIDKLLDSTKLAAVELDLDLGTIEQIRAEYRRYLQQPAPPPRPLHQILAEEFDTSPGKVHRVLCEYRLQTIRCF